MATCLDGPAAGRWFTGDRWPMLLRVTRDGAGDVRALAGADDVPGPADRVYLYRRRPGAVATDLPDGRMIVLAE